ncbi:hypothetical protein OK016_05700 [Vibrio chagasii]|nr:hypothetical protein [Vibrio chagasii]
MKLTQLRLKICKCSNSAQTCYNHCGSLHKQFTIQPGEEVRFAYVLGIGKGNGERLREKYQDTCKRRCSVSKASRITRDERCNKFQVKFQTKGLGHHDQHSTLYQAETRVVWSRLHHSLKWAAVRQVLATVIPRRTLSQPHANPAMTRKRSSTFKWRIRVKAGYGLHLFDPDWFDPEKAETSSHQNHQR